MSKRGWNETLDPFFDFEKYLIIFIISSAFQNPKLLDGVNFLMMQHFPVKLPSVYWCFVGPKGALGKSWSKILCAQQKNLTSSSWMLTLEQRQRFDLTFFSSSLLRLYKKKLIQNARHSTEQIIVRSCWIIDEWMQLDSFF